VYGAASALIGVGYLVAATTAGVTAGRRLPLVATVIVTVAVVLALHPARRRLNRWADRWAYGERLTGTALLSHFGETLEHAYDLHELAPRAATGVADGLGLRWARLSLILPGSDIAEPIGAAGIGLDDPAVPDVVIPLTDRDEVVGQIECGPRTRGGALGEDDHRLLTTVARQTALAVRNAHFAAELAGQVAEIRRQAEAIEESRRRLADAQDVERRRLERDIHDGVQQQIVVVMAQLRLARNQLGRDPASAGRTLEDAQRSAGETLVDLRELAQGIRPAVLSDRGLLAAVTTRVSRVPVGVTIDAGAGLSDARFPGDVEAAAYFMVAEGLTNALKHAGVEELRVSLAVEGDRLYVEVSDDGVGFVPADAVGHGLTGLADRVGAVGGRLHVDSRPGRGTRLRAELPTRRPADV
ncbi:MAG: GAF domain-containing sensor histidine kinase, partial [Nocardioidaceae bacterium]